MGSDRKRWLEEARRASMRDPGAWSTHELGAELAQTSADVYGAEAREKAAEARHLSERTPEAEIAYKGRRRETIRIRERYARLSEELVRRGAAAAGPEDRAGSEEADG